MDTKEVADHGYGFATYFGMTGNLEALLYQSKYVKKGSR